MKSSTRFRNCLTGTVSLKAICDSNPDQDILYLDDLPGVGRDFVTQLTNAELKTVENVVASLSNRALSKIRSEVKVKSGEWFRRTVSNQFHQTAYWCGTCNEKTLVGDRLDLKRIFTGGNVYSEINIDSVRVFTDPTDTFTGNPLLYFYDFSTGELLHQISFTVPPAGGLINVPVNYTFWPQGDLAVCLDLSQGPFCRWEPSGYCWECDRIGCNCDEKGACDRCGYVDTADPESLQLLPQIVQWDHKCFMSVNFDVGCSLDRFMCGAVENGLKEVYWLQMGIELLDESFIGKEINWVRLTDRETMKELRASLELYKVEAYEALMMSIDPANYCFQCEKGVTMVTQLP